MTRFNKIISLAFLFVACNNQDTVAHDTDSAALAKLAVEYQRCSAITPSRTGLSLRKLVGQESQRGCFRALNTELAKLVESAAKAKQAKIVSDIEAMQALKDNKRTVEYAAALASFLDLQTAVSETAPSKITEPAATEAPEAATVLATSVAPAIAEAAPSSSTEAE